MTCDAAGKEKPTEIRKESPEMHVEDIDAAAKAAPEPRSRCPAASGLPPSAPGTDRVCSEHGTAECRQQERRGEAILQFIPREREAIEDVGEAFLQIS
jgi:hypothetical protein